MIALQRVTFINLFFVQYREKKHIPNVTQKSGTRQEGAQDLSQAKPAPKQHNLTKLCDAGRLKSDGKPTQSKTDF
jgi:hypothetical protein